MARRTIEIFDPDEYPRNTGIFESAIASTRTEDRPESKPCPGCGDKRMIMQPRPVDPKSPIGTRYECEHCHAKEVYPPQPETMPWVFRHGAAEFPWLEGIVVPADSKREMTVDDIDAEIARLQGLRETTLAREDTNLGDASEEELLAALARRRGAAGAPSVVTLPAKSERGDLAPPTTYETTGNPESEPPAARRSDYGEASRDDIPVDDPLGGDIDPLS